MQILKYAYRIDVSIVNIRVHMYVYLRNIYFSVHSFQEICAGSEQWFRHQCGLQENFWWWWRVRDTTEEAENYSIESSWQSKAHK